MQPFIAARAIIALKCHEVAYTVCVVYTLISPRFMFELHVICFSMYLNMLPTRRYLYKI